MNAHLVLKSNVLAAAIASTLLAGCMSRPVAPEGSAEVRSKLTQLQSDPQLATRAPVAIKNAEQAVAAAEKPQQDTQLASHLVYLADRKVEIAQARAETRLLEDQRESLRQQREGARLDSRTREADSARMDAESARHEADMARQDAEGSRMDAESARMETASARLESEQARLDTEAANAQRIELEQQLAELNARPTERGMVITLGDLLFATGKSELKNSATGHLTKLAEFLKKTDRSVMIEGHTDSMGSDAFNLTLSQQRADSVKAFLEKQEVPGARIKTSGKGESTPIASNETAAGRQQNRRVEIIIINDTSPPAK